MPRRIRLSFEGAIHHVFFRGNARQKIFVTDGDRHRFVRSLADRVDTYQIRMFLYCLMPNHAHFLLETPLGNLPDFMESFLTSYAVYFNKRHNRVGHLTQGRYGSPLVEGDEYLLKLSRYIHLNPVSTSRWRHRPIDERLARLRSYRWSSYPGYAGSAEPEEFVEHGALLKLVTPNSRNPLQAYREFVESGLSRDDEELRKLMKKSALGIGSERFISDLEERYETASADSAERDEDSFRRVRRRRDPKILLRDICADFAITINELKLTRRNDWRKPIAAALLTKLGGLSQREVAAQLGLTSGAAVCLQLKKLRECSPKDVQDTLKSLELKLNI